MPADIQSAILGSSSGGNSQLEVDRTFKAARVALRPLEYASEGTVLGHYAVAQPSGAIAATPTALDAHASIRWTDTTRYLVLMRLRVGWQVISAVTTAVRMAYQASIVRGFSVDFTTASTAISLAAVSNTNKMRSNMGASLMGTAGPRICTTTVMSGQTYTLDAAPFGIVSFPPLTATNSTGTAVALPAGAGSPMMTLYECNANGQHPVVLTANEGVAVQLIHTGIATGTYSLYTEWSWAEVHVH